jgi:hypothetical protein
MDHFVMAQIDRVAESLSDRAILDRRDLRNEISRSTFAERRVNLMI